MFPIVSFHKITRKTFCGTSIRPLHVSLEICFSDVAGRFQNKRMVIVTTRPPRRTGTGSRKTAFTPLIMPRQTVDGTGTFLLRERSSGAEGSRAKPWTNFAQCAKEKQNREKMRCPHRYSVHRSFDRPTTGGSVLVPEIALNAAVSFCLNRCF